MIRGIFLFVLIFAALYLCKEGFDFYRALITGKSNFTTPKLILIGSAISYILTIIILGLPL